MQGNKIRLITERLGKARKAVRAALKEIRIGQAHLLGLRDPLFRAWEKRVDDHEERIRRNTEGVTRFSAAAGGFGLGSLAAFVQPFIGNLLP